MPASLTEVLARVAAAAQAAAALPDGLVDELAELGGLVHRPVDADLRAVVPQQDEGQMRLVGTALSASAYPALLWSGERFHRESTRWSARLAFVALTIAGIDAPKTALAPAVRGGETFRTLWPPAVPTAAHAGLTTDAVSVAVCAALASGISEEGLESVVELAASLMLVTATVPSPELAGMHAGHSLAAGWLAVQLHRCGVVEAPGTVTEVLSIREAS
jgi:hypothetical protein